MLKRRENTKSSTSVAKKGERRIAINIFSRKGKTKAEPAPQNRGQRWRRHFRFRRRQRTTIAKSPTNNSTAHCAPREPPQKVEGEAIEVLLAPPAPPQELPLWFLKAAKGDPIQGRQRYEETLEWRHDNHIDTILQEPFPNFSRIKKYYPHYYHLKGHQGQPVYYEHLARTNLKKLREKGVDMHTLIRHYTMITEFQWQLLAPDDGATSIFVVDLVNLCLRDFVGETVEFTKRVSQLSTQHYPERAGYVFVLSVPRWFALIWRVLRPIVDEATLHKIYILRHHQIRQHLLEQMPLENIPPEYGGTSVPLGQAPEE